MPENSEHAAVIVKVIVVDLDQFVHDAPSRALPSDSLQAWRNESAPPWITGAPLHWMRKPPRTTVPMRWTLALYCAAIASPRASDAGKTDTTARAPRSPKTAASA